MRVTVERRDTTGTAARGQEAGGILGAGMRATADEVAALLAGPLGPTERGVRAPWALGVYVAEPGHPIAGVILRGSGIVARPDAPGIPATQRLLFYEGNVYGAEGLAGWDARVAVAADRLLFDGGRGYPTVARALVPADAVRLVGAYTASGDGGRGRLLVCDGEAIARWLEARAG